MKIRTFDLSDKLKPIVEKANSFLQNSPDAYEYTLTACQNADKGYFLHKTEGAITVEYAKLTDLGRAMIAAAQVDGCLELNEKKQFDDFGYMLDCSRNAVPRLSTLKKLVSFLALLGYDFLGLYIEDTIKVLEEPYLGYMRGAFDPEEIKEISAYAAKYGMEIRPYVQSLAHFNQIKRYEEYEKMIDTDDILLADSERTYEFLDHYIKTIAECFSSRKINIGMDEAHMVGLGKYLDSHGYKDRFDIMYDHLKRVTKICIKYGMQPQIWSDMFFRLAFGGQYYEKDRKLDEKVILPKELEIVYWDYDSCDENHYDEMIRQHLQLTDKIGFAGGAWKWTGFAPHNRYSIESSKAALNACRKNHVNSVVITGWGDNGGEASQFSNLPALFADANMAYESKVTNTVFQILTGMKWEEFMLIDCTNPLSGNSGKHNNASKYFLYNDPLTGTFDSVAEELYKDYFKNTVKRLEACIDLQPKTDFIYLLETQKALCDILQLKADLGIRMRKAYREKDMVVLKDMGEAEIPRIINNLDLFYRTFRKQWYLENKTFGFEIQSHRIGGLKQRLQEVADRILSYVNGDLISVEEMEEEYLPFHYFEENQLESLNYNLWSNIVSPAVIG